PKNAWIPSAASSLRSVGMKASSSISIDLAIGASRPSSTALMMAAVASGARLPSWRASAFASASVSLSLQSRLTRRSCRHSGAGKRRAEVGAAAEDLVAGAGDDHGAHGVVVAHRVERVVQLADERLADGVGRRAIEGDDRERLLAREHERFKSHRG